MTDLTDGTVTVLIGDVRERLAELEAGSVHYYAALIPRRFGSLWGQLDLFAEGVT